MVDPVSLSNGSAYSRVAIEEWFGSGEKTDPVTGESLEDLSFRLNIQWRESIQEWKELNYCKAKLVLENESSVKDAVFQIQELVKEDSINKDWNSIGGLTELLVNILPNLRNQQIKTEVLVTLKDAMEGHARNKDLVVLNKGFCRIVPCLGCESSLSKAALELIYELVLEEFGKHMDYTRELSQQCNPVSFLVTVLKSSEPALAEKAHEILQKFFDVDEENVIRAAKEEWYKPLVDRILQGSKSTKTAMLTEIVKLELEEHNTKILCELGLISLLLEMASADLKTKELALSMLVKLLTSSESKLLFAAAGGVSVTVDIMFSPPLQVPILAKCSEIIEKLSSNCDGIKFLYDVNGIQLNLDSLVVNLLAFFQNSRLSDTVFRPVLRALFKICASKSGLVKTAVVTANGVSLVLNLLDHLDSETREAAIFYFYSRVMIHKEWWSSF